MKITEYEEALHQLAKVQALHQYLNTGPIDEITVQLALSVVYGFNKSYNDIKRDWKRVCKAEIIKLKAEIDEKLKMGVA